LNVHGVSDVRWIKIFVAGLLPSDLSRFEFEIAVAKLKRYKLASRDQNSSRTDSSRKNCSDQWKESVTVLVYMKCN
jgi:hypothetical protein